MKPSNQKLLGSEKYIKNVSLVLLSKVRDVKKEIVNVKNEQSTQFITISQQCRLKFFSQFLSV